jgi:hypothetical protein
VLELDQENMLTLCEGSGNHHLWWGHLGSWLSWNKTCRTDCAAMARRIRERPT